MIKFYWRFRRWLDKYFYDDRYAAQTRLLFFFFSTGVIVLLGYYLFEDLNTIALEIKWKEGFPIFFIQWIIVGVIRFLNFIVYGFRHAIIPVSMFIGVLIASAYYVQDVYELPTFRLAMRYIFASFTGVGYPNMTIKEGKAQIKKGEINLIDTIGGPGYINIRPGNVVLFESLRSPSSVRSSALHFISRFETIREIVSLDDQHGYIEKMRAKTRDGIQVVVRDVHYRYRLRTGRRFGDHEKRRAINPYPYSVQAVKDMAYNRSASSTGLTDWHSTIQLAVNGAITDYIKSHKFDQLTAPSYEDDDPRADIARKMMSKGIRTRLRNWGAELLWFDIGHFEVSEAMQSTIEDQRVDTWSARWDGDAMVIRAEGEARRMAYQEIGRAEGQAALLQSIIHALEEARFEGELGDDEHKEPIENLRAIVWARVAQIFDAAAGDENTRSQKSPPRSSS